MSFRMTILREMTNGLNDCMTHYTTWTPVSDALPPLGRVVRARWADGTELRIKRLALTDDQSGATITGAVVWADERGWAIQRNDWPEEWRDLDG